jgi:hypothetical protein
MNPFRRLEELTFSGEIVHDYGIIEERNRF